MIEKHFVRFRCIAADHHRGANVSRGLGCVGSLVLEADVQLWSSAIVRTGHIADVLKKVPQRPEADQGELKPVPSRPLYVQNRTDLTDLDRFSCPNAASGECPQQAPIAKHYAPGPPISITRSAKSHNAGVCDTKNSRS